LTSNYSVNVGINLIKFNTYSRLNTPNNGEATINTESQPICSK